jgi:ribokinase
VLARLGVDVGFVGRVGQDALAAQALADLDDAGVDTRLVQLDPTVSTGVIFIAVTPDGERTMFGARGANSHTDPHLLDESYFAGLLWFHFSGYTLLADPQRSAALQALRLARRAGARVSLDVGMEPALRARGSIQRLLPEVDILFPNETELLLLADGVNSREGSRRLLQQGVGAVVAKHGAGGSEVTAPEVNLRLPAFDISPVDTTGAGDCFDAGFIFGRLAGLSWGAATLLGNAVGALSTQWHGGGARHISLRDLSDLIRTCGNAPAWSDLGTLVQTVLACLESRQ